MLECHYYIKVTIIPKYVFRNEDKLWYFIVIFNTDH